jgi:hypothetical protein
MEAQQEITLITQLGKTFTKIGNTFTKNGTHKRNLKVAGFGTFRWVPRPFLPARELTECYCLSLDGIHVLMRGVLHVSLGVELLPQRGWSLDTTGYPLSFHASKPRSRTLMSW